MAVLATARPDRHPVLPRLQAAARARQMTDVVVDIFWWVFLLLCAGWALMWIVCPIVVFVQLWLDRRAERHDPRPGYLEHRHGGGWRATDVPPRTRRRG